MTQDAITMALIVIGSIIGLLMIAAVFVKEQSNWVFRWNRFKKSELELSVKDLARSILDKAGLTEVEIRGGIFYRYKRSKKTIVMSFYDLKRNSLTGYAMALQLTSVAIMDAKGEKRIPRFYLVDFLGGVSALLIFMFIVGFLVTIASIIDLGIINVVVLGLALALYITTFVMSIMNIKAQKLVNKEAEALAENLAIFDQDELKRINKINRAYTRQRVIESLLSVFYVLYTVLSALKIFNIRRR